MLQHAATESSLVRRLRREHLIEKKLSQVLEKIGKMKVTFWNANEHECVPVRFRLAVSRLACSQTITLCISSKVPIDVCGGYRVLVVVVAIRN